MVLMWQPDPSAAVPKFGDWDESNPASSEGYTAIFNRVREEKQVEAGKMPAAASEPPYSNGYKQPGNENSKVCTAFLLIYIACCQILSLASRSKGVCV
jgi:RPM1-interacting protein 4